MRRLVALLRLLDAVTERLESVVTTVDVTGPAERRRLLAAPGGAEREVPPAGIADLVAAQAARTPDRTALLAGRDRLDYRELDVCAARLAGLLAARGAGPGNLVGVLLPRGADLLVTLLAVACAGAAYLPLDPDFPAERIAYMLADAAPALLVTDRATADGDALPDVEALPGGRPIVLDDESRAAPLALPRAAHPQHGAYVIYTSGSTCRPKGVVVPRAAVANLLACLRAELRPHRRRAAPRGDHRWLRHLRARTLPAADHRRHRRAGQPRRGARPRAARRPAARQRRHPRAGHALAVAHAVGGRPRSAARPARAQRRRGAAARPGRAVGRARRSGGRPVRAHRDHRLVHGRRHRAPRGRHLAGRPPAVEHPRLRPGPRAGPGAHGPDRRAVPDRRRGGPQLPGPARAQRRALRGRPARRARPAHVPHRRSGQAALRRHPRHGRPRRPAGQDLRPPGGARRGGGGVARRRPGARRRRPGHRGRRPAGAGARLVATW